MTEIFKIHFLNPLNMGKLKGYTHYNKEKSGFCGDTVEVFAIVENNVVKDIKYNVFGCHAVIATSSILSEWCKGKTIDEILAISMNNIDGIVGELESGKENCIEVALRAFQNIK